MPVLAGRLVSYFSQSSWSPPEIPYWSTTRDPARLEMKRTTRAFYKWDDNCFLKAVFWCRSSGRRSWDRFRFWQNCLHTCDLVGYPCGVSHPPPGEINSRILQDNSELGLFASSSSGKFVQSILVLLKNIYD